MPKYQTGDEKKYFSGIVAALIVISIAVASFIYSLIAGGEKNRLEEEYIETEGGIDPSGNMGFPTQAPNIVQPTMPPNN
ncbi:MAG: hypothetical protein AAB373_00085 [Patescibacteria group bacterium]